MKPQNKNQEFEKIGFSKHFSPYDWFIGTGEYVIDVENDIKQRLLRRISQINYGTNRYIFVIDYQGNYLSHHTKSPLENDNQSLTTMKRIIDVAKQGEDYLYYISSVMPSTAKPADKISYIVGLPDWEWAIGSGVYISEIENYLTTRKKLLANNIRISYPKFYG